MYLWKPLWEQTVAVNLNKLPIGVPAKRGVDRQIKTWDYSWYWHSLVIEESHYRLDNWIDNFWARALQSEVFPVPGGPEF